MTNDKLPEEMQDRIHKEAVDAKFHKSQYTCFGVSYLDGYEDGYDEGATAWAPWKVKHDELQAQAQRMADALEALNKAIDKAWNECNTKSIPDKYKKEIATAQALSCNALQQFQDGREGVKNEQV